MSRTYRRARRSSRSTRDGAFQYAAASCRHHGGCPVCTGNRTFSSRRQIPADDGTLAENMHILRFTLA